MSKLTIHFIDPLVESITIEGCEAEFMEDNTSFVLPADGGSKQTQIASSALKASDGDLHGEFSDSMDAYVFFNTRTEQFRFWQGDGDNKGRGFYLDTENLLPGMARIDVEAEESDD